MRPVRIIAAIVVAATVGMLTLLAAPAWAAPVAIHVSPSSVAAGHTVTLSGSVGPDSAGSECASRVTLISKAFVHTYDFAGLPAAVTGLPIQPATPAAAQSPSRWIIPGLAALGSGTLAALGVWLLYRRRHPAGSSRRGRSRMAH